MAWRTPVRRRLAGAELLATLLYLPHAIKSVTGPMDAWTHLFLASHYLFGWWTTTDHRWYLGMDTTTYPPLAHQLLAAVAWPFTQVFSMATALELTYIILTLVLTLAYPLGVYAFATTLVDQKSAALAAIAGALFSGWWMMLYGFGQFPTLTALVFVLFGARALNDYLTHQGVIAGILAVLLTALVPMTHHFSTISVLPAVYGIVVFKHLYQSDTALQTVVWRAASVALPAVAIASVALYPFVLFLLDGIARPVIPHGSRTPWYVGSILDRSQFWYTLFSGGLFLTITPLVGWMVRSRRLLLASTVVPVLFGVLSLGFTTQLPTLIYGSLAPQLTYYRFAAWGGILLLPAVGLALDHLLANPTHALGFIIVGMLMVQGVVVTQMPGGWHMENSPDRRADVKEIANVLNKGENSRWRYLALGMSQELGAIGIRAPRAQTIDGGYHRARNPANVPRLVKSGTPQLADAKFKRWDRNGLQANNVPVLTYYLANKNEYHLKYVFSTDPYYESMLREHGYVLLWEWPWVEVRGWFAPDVPPMDEDAMSTIGSDTPWYAYPWGTIPLATFVSVLVITAGAGIRRYTNGWLDVA